MSAIRSMTRAVRHPGSRLSPARAGAALAFAFVLGVVAACGGPSVDVQAQQSFEGLTDTRTVEASVPEEAEDLTLTLDLEIEEGEVAYRVIDPSGTVRWEGQTSGHLQDERTFTTRAGEWRLEMDMSGATGRYQAAWGAGGPWL